MPIVQSQIGQLQHFLAPQIDIDDLGIRGDMVETALGQNRALDEADIACSEYGDFHGAPSVPR